MACIRLTDYAEAASQLTACLELNRQMGDRRGEARTHQVLGDGMLRAKVSEGTVKAINLSSI